MHQTYLDVPGHGQCSFARESGRARRDPVALLFVVRSKRLPPPVEALAMNANAEVRGAAVALRAAPNGRPCR
jgi:hypothetical protein